MAQGPKVKVELSGRDVLECREDGSLNVVGCRALLDAVAALRGSSGDEPANWMIPTGHGHEELMLREFILRRRGEWQPPYQHEELCHCRAVPTAVVCEAIIAGAHTTEAVSRRTSASTSCGTCRPDSQKMISYYLNRPEE